MRTTLRWVTFRASSSSRLKRRSSSSTSAWLLEHLGADDLQRDGDAELLVPRLVHGAHAADAQHPEDGYRLPNGSPTWSVAAAPRGAEAPGVPGKGDIVMIVASGSADCAAGRSVCSESGTPPAQDAHEPSTNGRVLPHRGQDIL